MTDNKPQSGPPKPAPSPKNQVVSKSVRVESTPSSPPPPKPGPQNVFINEATQKVIRQGDK